VKSARLVKGVGYTIVIIPQWTSTRGYASSVKRAVIVTTGDGACIANEVRAVAEVGVKKEVRVLIVSKRR
jgi:hypothetical protein